MDWLTILLISPFVIAIFLMIFNLVWNDVLNPHLANYSRFNGRNEELGSDACVKLTYKQWRDFAAIKPEVFCIRSGCLYEVDKSAGCWGQYTKIHFNLLDYVKFVAAYNRMKDNEEKAAVHQKEKDDMSAFIHRMQVNIKEYRSKIDDECTAAKNQLSKVAENMLKQNKECYSLNKKLLCYKGTYPSTPFIRRVGDLYMSKDGKKMYVIDKDLNTQTWEADKLLTYISKESMDAEEAFDFVTSPVSELDVTSEKEIKYNYRGNGLTKMISQMKAGDIYYNPVLKKYMVMESTGEINYLTTNDFVDRFAGINSSYGGINSCQNVWC